MVREDIKISAEEGLRYYELKKLKPWFDKAAQNYSIKRNKLNCNSYRT
jgi:hypothetical protein